MVDGFERIATPDIEWASLVPHIVMVGMALLLLTVASLVGRRLPGWFCTAWTMAAGLATFAVTVPVWLNVQDEGASSAVAGAIGVDGFSAFVIVLLAGTVVLVPLAAADYLRREELDGPAFHVLLMLSAAGGMTMASANDLIVLFLGLEVLSLAVYVLAAMHLRREESQEAGLKYFVLGAFASAFLLYGIALVYGATGSTSLADVNDFLAAGPLNEDGLLLAGLGFLLVGFAFKVAAVPFHAWTPDVYEGAPSPVVAYMAAGVKAAGFAALVRVFVTTFGERAEDWQPVLLGLSAASLVVGSVMAIVQSDVKRTLAYSSISHAGFILLGVQAATPDGTSGVLFYLAAYAAMALGSFTVVTVVAGPGDSGTSLDAFRGLAARRPLLAAAFTVLLLSQAGVPFTSGFWAKFEVIGAAVDARSFWLAVIAMLAAVVAAFLYLRIMVSMYLDDPADDSPGTRTPRSAAVALGVVVSFTVAFGVYPGPLAELARDAVPVLVGG